MLGNTLRCFKLQEIKLQYNSDKFDMSSHIYVILVVGKKIQKIHFSIDLEWTLRIKLEIILKFKWVSSW